MRLLREQRRASGLSQRPSSARGGNERRSPRPVIGPGARPCPLANLCTSAAMRNKWERAACHAAALTHPCKATTSSGFVNRIDFPKRTRQGTHERRHTRRGLLLGPASSPPPPLPPSPAHASIHTKWPHKARRHCHAAHAAGRTTHSGLGLSLLCLAHTRARGRTHFLPAGWSWLRGDGDIKGATARAGAASSAEARSRSKPCPQSEPFASQ